MSWKNNQFVQFMVLGAGMITGHLMIRTVFGGTNQGNRENRN